jgi:amino acid transporter
MPKSLKSWLIGRPLSAQEMHSEKLGKIQALAVFSSDALSSVAYATEAILFELAAIAGMPLDWSLPISAGICFLLIILLVSYRQTIHEYPNGGGAYTVSKNNLGEIPSLVAGSALLLDYLLTVSVSVTAGIEAITSAFPVLIDLKILLCMVSIWLIVLGNLRGLRDSGKIFTLPTYIFVFSILALIGWGLTQAFTGHLSAEPIRSEFHFAFPAIGIFAVLQAFSAGCTALTGVEAVSNGVPAFRKPEADNAVITLIWMVVLLGVMFIGISVLAHLLHVVPNENETVVSQIAHHIFGSSILYYVIQLSTMLILILAANTAFADFPRLCSLLATDRYLPRQLASLGDRLVFSNGILALGFFASILVILFKGDTRLLLPLYAVGVFISFTLSQTGMVVKYYREKKKGWVLAASINSVGAIATTVVLVVIGATRFLHGAWLVVVLIPIIVIAFKKIHGHYTSIAPQLATTKEDFVGVQVPMNFLVLIPVSNLHKGMIRAIRFAHTISDDVIALSVDINSDATARLQRSWEEANPGIPLVVLPSPFRSLSDPLLGYISDRINEASRAEREVILLVPEFITARWWHHFLHNQTAVILRTYLWLKYPELVVTSVRHRLQF